MKRQEILREDYPSTAGKCLSIESLDNAKFETTYLQIDNVRVSIISNAICSVVTRRTASHYFDDYCTKEITEAYQFGMTKAVCYRGARNDSTLMAKYVEMRLPPIPPMYIKPPMYGKLQLPKNAVDFSVSRRFIVRYLPQARLKTLRALQWIRSLWFNSFVDKAFVDTTLTETSLPTKLTEFSKLQAAQCAELFDVLSKSWQRSVSDHVTDLVMANDIYNMFETHFDEYVDSNVFKLLKNITFRMCTQLTQIVEGSCNQWVRFLESFVNNLAPLKESKGDRKQLDNQNSRQSLFDMKMTVDDKNKVIFEPSPVEFEQTLIEILNRIVSQACTVPTFEAQIMQLLSLEPRMLLDLESDNRRRLHAAGGVHYAEIVHGDQRQLRADHRAHFPEAGQ